MTPLRQWMLEDPLSRRGSAAGRGHSKYLVSPGVQSLFLTSFWSVVMQGAPLVTGPVDVPTSDQDALIKALRVDQAGESTFPEFLAASWRAGVVRYDVDFAARTVAYFGCNGDEYIEAYPSVEIGQSTQTEANVGRPGFSLSSCRTTR
jgi:uncharacterized protein YbcV (DUF1398 family)